MGDFGQPLFFADPAQASPITVFEVDGVTHDPVADILIVGEIVGVEAGKGYSWPRGPQVVGEPDTRAVHDFDSPAAELVTVHLVVSVTDTVAPDPALESDQMRIGISLIPPQDLDALAAELVGRRIAAPLMDGSRTAFDLEEGVWGIVDDGSLLGFVDSSDQVTFGAFSTTRWPGGVSFPVVPLERLLNPPTHVRLSTVDGVLIGDEG